MIIILELMLTSNISCTCMSTDGSVKVTDGYNPEDPALSSTCTSKSDFLPVPLMLPMGPRFGTLPPPIPGMAMSRRTNNYTYSCIIIL